MLGRIFINCDDAHVLSTRDQYRDLNPKEAFRLKIHKSHCTGCRSFHMKNKSFTRMVNRLKYIRLTDDEKNRIKSALKEHLKDFKQK
jgi:hypothetical protein